MERTEETLKARVREAPLTDRLIECRKRIGKMCAEGRAPRMCIPVQHDDDDFFICTTLADAQATVEALQRERDGLEAKCLEEHVTIEQADAKVMKLEGDKGMWANERIVVLTQLENAESQLSQLQALVRAISETMEPFRLSLAKLDEVDTLATRRIAEADAYYCAQRVLSTLPATPTEEAPVKGGDGE